ncbi:MAG: sulfatase [Burkholderiales bacterium]|nr:sulfatase [Burkholderiales bacterium]
MKCVFLLFDSLNRHALSCYGGATVATPNFARLAARSTVFDRHFVGSLPCMPARRDIQTGRLNFLHRGWGPLEPFDHSLAAILRDSGIVTHLITDHYHYFEDGGAGFHGRYSSWEFIRGQEKDKWRAPLDPARERFAARFHERQHDFSPDINSKLPYYVNREHLEATGAFPLAQCFDAARGFLDAHHASDDWFLHLECFDPHEPFFAPERFLAAFPEALGGKIFDWPTYGHCDLDPALLGALRANYHALVAACDHYLGQLLDCFDRHDLWRDTWLIMSTDHGLLLGEKELLGKNRPPFYNEIAHIPLTIAAPPASGHAPGRCAALTQAIDLMPTVLDIFGRAVPPEVTGRSLVPALGGRAAVRASGCIFGQFGAAINYTDGHHAYFLYPREPFEADLFQYTLSPSHMRSFFEPGEFAAAEVVRGLPFTRGYPVWRLPVQKEAAANMTRRYPLIDAHDALFDLGVDPAQRRPLEDPALAAQMRASIAALMHANDAPDEMFARYRLRRPGT